MKVLKIQGNYEGYVSVFAKLDSDLIKNFKKFEEKYERLEAAEESIDYVVFSNGIDAEKVSLAITLDDEILYSGSVGSLPNSYDIAERDDLPAFETLLDNPDEQEIRILLQEWIEDGLFELEVEVSDEFNLANLEIFALDLEQGDALSWALFDQANFEIGNILDHFIIEGKRYEIVGDGDGLNRSANFMKISQEGKIAPDFDLD
jgi:hypothetical protein